MLAPNKTKYRKMQKGRLRGPATRGTAIDFGEVGIKAMEHGKLTSQQIEAARVAIMRHIKRGGKVWIRVFPDRVITEKPAEVRQGKGKGAPVGWFAAVKPGRMLYEIKGVDLETAKEALTRAMRAASTPSAVVLLPVTCQPFVANDIASGIPNHPKPTIATFFMRILLTLNHLY